MHPGQHVIVIGAEVDSLKARATGLTLRDTVLILLPGPRVQHACLFRVPLEGTVAENVMKHGSGGLNIDGCRIYSAPGDRKDRVPGGDAPKWGTNTYAKDAYSLSARGDSPANALGRWPTNLILVHGPECRQTGCKSISVTASRWKHYTDTPKGASNTYAHDAWTKESFTAGGVSHDKDGTETVAAWECQDDCPVRMLDGQSNRSISPTDTRPKRTGTDFGVMNDDTWKPKGCVIQGYGDSGTASRFFPQFANLQDALAWLQHLIGRPDPV